MTPFDLRDGFKGRHNLGNIAKFSPPSLDLCLNFNSCRSQGSKGFKNVVYIAERNRSAAAGGINIVRLIRPPLHLVL